MRFLFAVLLLVFCAAGCTPSGASPAARSGSPVEQVLASGRCPDCGATLFHARPGITTKEDIRDLAAQSKLPDKEEIMADGWIHPGAYCPNGCFEVLSSGPYNKP